MERDCLCNWLSILRYSVTGTSLLNPETLEYLAIWLGQVQMIREASLFRGSLGHLIIISCWDSIGIVHIRDVLHDFRMPFKSEFHCKPACWPITSYTAHVQLAIAHSDGVARGREGVQLEAQGVRTLHACGAWIHKCIYHWHNIYYMCIL